MKRRLNVLGLLYSVLNKTDPMLVTISSEIELKTIFICNDLSSITILAFTFMKAPCNDQGTNLFLFPLT